MATMTMEQIRSQYPHPEQIPATPDALRARVYAFDAYCVGGAVCRAAGLDATHGHFPSTEPVHHALRALNPHLDSLLAMAFARQILTDNDYHSFESAWALVREALAYTHVPDRRLA